MASEEIEAFFGVYLLYCTNPKYKGQTYIGFTVDPNRRINQHNKGKWAGGAKRTSNRGPWEMVLIVHGFPNNITALRFEWAWQFPHRSRRLRHLNERNKRNYDSRLKVLSEMLRIGPWNRLPLIIRWLQPEFERPFSAARCPPLHMPITYGQIVRKHLKPSEDEEEDIFIFPLCDLCHGEVGNEDKLDCLKPNCTLSVHIVCLAKNFLENGSSENIIPVDGICPACKECLLWGHLIRKKLGCQDL